jgi:hypothetical protein
MAQEIVHQMMGPIGGRIIRHRRSAHRAAKPQPKTETSDRKMGDRKICADKIMGRFRLTANLR